MTKRRRFWLVTGSLFLLLCISFISTHYHFNWSGTGFTNKTLWDWLQLLIVPLALTIIAFVFNRSTTRAEQTIVLDKQREDLLQTYLDRMSELLLEKELNSSNSKGEARKIARIRTITILFQLDARRIGYVFAFLREAGLTSNTSESIVSLENADLSQINLSQAFIGKADLSEASSERPTSERPTSLKPTSERPTSVDPNLAKLTSEEPIFAEPISERPTFSKANLTEANLSEGHLREAGFNRAYLREADFSKAEPQKI